MNVERLSRAQRRIISLTILLVLIVMAITLVALPYDAIMNRYDDRVQRLNEKLSTQRAIVRDGEVARGQLITLERIEVSNGYFLSSDKPALASAELQRRVKQVIEQSGGTVVSSQMMRGKNDHEVEQVVLRVQMRCGVDELQKVLHTLEAQQPILLLDNIFIGARPAGGIMPGRGKEAQQQLDVRIDVAGYRHVPNGSPASDQAAP